MKKLFLALSVSGLLAIGAQSQVKTPQPSPSATVEQTVGLTNITIEYSRPGVKGRKIFGELVPYGEMWRTGANKAVQFSIDTPVEIEGKQLSAGHYALFTVPNKDNWDIIFYEETEIWGTPENWVDSLEALRVNVKTKALKETVETFTISIDNIVKGETADLSFSWENTKVTVKIKTPTSEITMSSIEKTMAGPDANDYYRSATYFYETDQDLEKAYGWIQKAVELRGEEAFWYLRMQSLIEAKMGKTDKAIITAKRSMASAKEAGNEDYVRMNQASIDEWTKK
ncbi:MAG: DUF2911 domain-containing protein [Crocinitomicaceae bacterium]